MNARRRESLTQALEMLRGVKTTVDRIAEEENDAMENMPENFQDTDRYYSMEDACDALSDASDSLDDAIDSIQEAINS